MMAILKTSALPKGNSHSKQGCCQGGLAGLVAPFDRQLLLADSELLKHNVRTRSCINARLHTTYTRTQDSSSCNANKTSMIRNGHSGSL
eukprot:scaffold195205_cov32-Prasinocladus_malaysianus.AAC.1